MIVTVNNSDNDFCMNLPARNEGEYIGGLSGIKVFAKDGRLSVDVKANSGEIWLPVFGTEKGIQPIEIEIDDKPEPTVQEKISEPELPVKTDKDFGLRQNKTYEEMTIEELQEAIIERMKQNGPVTERMKKDVLENVYHNSLVTWIKSFN